MRLDRGGVGVEEGLEYILALDLLDALIEVGVTLVQSADDGVRLLVGQLQAQYVVLHVLVPNRVELLVVLRPRGVLAVDAIGFFAVEVEWLLEQAARIGHALADALNVDVEDVERWLQLAIADRVIQGGAIGREGVDIGLGKKQLLVVQRLEVVVENLRRQRVIERARLVVIAAVAEQSVNTLRGKRLVAGWCARHRLAGGGFGEYGDRKSTRLNSSH